MSTSSLSISAVSTTREALVTLETFLSKQLDYRHIILFSSDTAAFGAAFSLLAEPCDVFTSANAPITLFDALASEKKKALYYDLRLDGTVETRLLERTRSEQTRVFVATHNHGVHSDLKTIAAFCKAHDLLLIEDASQLLYTREKGAADIALYTLEALIPATLARGAFLATDDPEIAQKLKVYAAGGVIATKLWNYDVINKRDEQTLAPLIAHHALRATETLQTDLQQIKTIQRRYLEALSSNRLITLPKEKDLTPYPRFPIFLTPALFCPKEDIYQALIDAGVPVAVGNKPIYKTTAFQDETLSLFGAEELFKSQLLLPAHASMTENDVDHVIKTLQTVLETYGYRGCSF